MRPIESVAMLALVALGSSACGVSESAVATGIAQTGEAQALHAIAQTATAVAMATDTPTVTLTPTPASPTRTPAPAWCSENAYWYLREVDRILTGADNAISYWNNSARGDAELLQTEVVIRDLIAEGEALDAPTDFQEMHPHFLNYLHGILTAIFGITDQSEEHREGGNATLQEELDMTLAEWDRALAVREQVCP